MSMQSHIESLEQRHTSLQTMLDTLTHSPSATDAEMRDVKRRKLKLKDEIARLRVSAE